ncbi:MAG: hypothetical protein JWQ61_2533 [Collimonas fungivorans]|uniref:hypothetical protein n=1 Tax=Collimonas fungivorans TaxID=158899 RepID=UPI0026EEF66B|nr:hypothetical protein [Collimonas fungivorans]MDB5767719.1 hypothetical protein [Collimonas fungivorans]
MGNNEENKPGNPAAARPEERYRQVPQGFRPGLITAITVLLGFSLTFLRFWGVEDVSHWTWHALGVTFALGVVIALQIVALFRALRIEDDEVREYRKTVRWFIASTILLLVGLLVAALD